MDHDDAVEALRGRNPGSDPRDPYADVDPTSLPPWWQDAVEEFADHDLRPYRPPRFADGTYVHEIRDRLETALGIEITIGATGDEFRNRWTVRVDGEPTTRIPRYRSADGYTVYDVDPSTFETRIRAGIET